MTDWTDTPDIVKTLAARLDDFDWPGADVIVDELIDRLDTAAEPFPKDDAPRLLDQLRRKRQFDAMARLAAAFVKSGRGEAKIRRQQAQAHIDRGDLDAAEPMLMQMILDRETSPFEVTEARGLLGRIYKQRYVNARNPADLQQQRNLRQAISHYDAVYSADAKKTWHGINVVACLARGERDGVDVTAVRRKSAVDFASDILARLREMEEQDGALKYWDRATSMEAHVALDRRDEAIQDVRDYVLDAGIDAFECSSTLRQLREVWGVDEHGGNAGAQIAGALSAALLKRSGGELELQAKEVERGLQANFTGVPDLPLKWWRTGLERCAAIARIEDEQGHKIGTGFLVRRRDFIADGSDERLLLTNWHVVSKGRRHPKSIPPESAWANFEAANCRVKVKDIVAYNAGVDASFLSLDGWGSGDHCPIEPVPAPYEVAQKPRVYVIGYPGGRDLSFSIHDSLWLDTDGTKFHYRTPTEPGSSGSPVFDQAGWVLVALHHAGLQAMPKLNGKAGVYQANEAFSVAAIQAALKISLKSS
jgi:hypothetical protein